MTWYTSIFTTAENQKDYGIEVHSEVTTRKKNKAKVIAAITSHLLEIVK